VYNKICTIRVLIFLEVEIELSFIKKMLQFDIVKKNKIFTRLLLVK